VFALKVLLTAVAKRSCLRLSVADKKRLGCFVQGNDPGELNTDSLVII